MKWIIYLTNLWIGFLDWTEEGYEITNGKIPFKILA
jgi:hypothetical protein